VVGLVWSGMGGKIEACPGSPVELWAAVPDHRRASGRRYRLNVVLAISVSAMLSGARSLFAIAPWAREHRRLVTSTFGLPAEWTPSHATLHRVFKGLDVEAFESVLYGWLSETCVPLGDGIAGDGKTLRGIHGEQIAGVHLVAAYAHAGGVVLAQAASPEEGQELAAGREVIGKAPIAGHIVTIDALYACRAFCRDVLGAALPRHHQSELPRSP
jgi:hypothetical protein